MKKIFPILFFAFLLPVLASANNLPDRDGDGVPDQDELGIYQTDPDNPDTDNDGYSDWAELNAGFSPHNPLAVKLEDNDQDHDALSDRLELAFGTKILDPDTDQDGFKDGEEIAAGYDPRQGNGAILKKRIEINLGRQELSYFLGQVRLGKFPVSSGKKGMWTPVGHFRIDGKHPRAWSSYGLWMPWWMSLKNGYFGIHELPEWPNGAKEGADHLGRPVSHGCVRLGVGPAKLLYDWTPIGTEVFIY